MNSVNDHAQSSQNPVLPGEATSAATDVSPAARRAGSTPWPIYLLAVPVCLGVIVLYIWLVSVGFWTVWPRAAANRNPNYTDWLATAFQHGQLALVMQPDAALLKLPNPYDPRTRNGVPFPLDVSLYNGKFYLYWGPTPAAILAVVKTFFPHQVGDQYLDFAFVAGLFIVNALGVIAIWRRFFPNIPGWMVLFCVLLVGVIYPLPLLLYDAAVYEVAVAGGQFFFMSGFFLAWAALVGPKPSGWKLALAAGCWVCAVGCRTTLVLPVAVVALFTLLWLVRAPGQAGAGRTTGYALMALGGPLVLGLLAYLWYNWARFGAPLETGLYYQLAGHYIQKDYAVIFSWAYVPQNIYNYFANPVSFRSAFPYLKALPGGMQTASLHWYVFPRAYVPGKSMGLFLTAPFVFFAAIPSIKSLSGLARGGWWKRLAQEEPAEAHLLQWMSLSLLGACLSACLAIMMYYSVAARYLGDFVPALALLSVIGFWQGYGLLSGRRVWRNLYTILGICLIMFSVLLSVPLAIADNLQRFYSFNPVLLTQIRRACLQLINTFSPPGRP